MKNVISSRGSKRVPRKGRGLNRLPPGVTIPDSLPGRASAFAGKSLPSGAPLNSRSPRLKLEAFFNSPQAQRLKEQMCEMGRRSWSREYVEGNGGNMAIRVGKDIAICTPTLVSKGFMKPEDLCLVDFEGHQIVGARKPTSEILMHLQVMKRQPRAVATCHCHPPYATAFAAVGEAPPQCILPECELVCSVAVAPYRTPGSPEMGRLVAGLTDQHDTILMANHGVVTWSHNSIEEAYWRVEIIEAYCRTIVAARQLGKPLNMFTGPELKEILSIKKRSGFVDPRYDK